MKILTLNKLIIASTVASLLFVGCSDDKKDETKDDHGSSHGWSYYGETGPEYWGHLSPEYSIALTGKEQSPIDIKTANVVKNTVLPPITYDYSDADIEVINNGHTVQGNLQIGSNHLTIGTKRYDLAQFHFHTLSENTVNGKHAPIEMHMVHKTADGELAVVGVMFEEGVENSTLKELCSHMPKAHETYSCKEKVAIDELIPANRTAYRFDGSLTTPPCTEGVKWTVMANNLELSAEQIGNFKELFSGHEFPEGNRRPVQPVNERTIYIDEM